jgi:hypothetical protein
MRDDLSLAMNKTTILDDGDQLTPRRRAQAALVKLRARIARRPGRWRRRMNKTFGPPVPDAQADAS